MAISAAARRTPWPLFSASPVPSTLHHTTAAPPPHEDVLVDFVPGLVGRKGWSVANARCMVSPSAMLFAGCIPLNCARRRPFAVPQFCDEHFQTQPCTNPHKLCLPIHLFCCSPPLSPSSEAGKFRMVGKKLLAEHPSPLSQLNSGFQTT